MITMRETETTFTARERRRSHTNPARRLLAFARAYQRLAKHDDAQKMLYAAASFKRQYRDETRFKRFGWGYGLLPGERGKPRPI